MAAAFLIFGAIFVVYWVYLRKRAATAGKWPSVPGQIVESRLYQERDVEGQLTWQLQLAYSYRVADSVLQSRRISFGPIDPNRAARRYPMGARVDVFYDPQNPTSAVLEQVKSGAMRWVLALGCVCVVIGVILAAGSGGVGNAYDRAVDLYKQGNYAAARAAFLDLAQKGSAESRVYMGVFYAKGQGVAQDFVEAQKWFILAGDAGKNNRAEVAKGLRPDQEAEAEKRAATWAASR